MRLFLHIILLCSVFFATVKVHAESSSSSSYPDFGDDHEDDFDSSYADKPQNISAEPISTSVIKIHWEPPFGESRLGSLLGYRIKFKSRGQKKSETVEIQANRHYYEIEGLERGTTYMFKMWAVFSNDSGPTTEWVQAETLLKELDDSVVPDKPGQIRARTEDGAIHLTWSQPKNRSILIQGYNIGWGVGFPDIFSRLVEGDRRAFTIDGDLQPNSEYVISVKAFNRAGEGRPSYETVKTPSLNEDGDFDLDQSSSPFSGSNSGSLSNSGQIMPPVALKAEVTSSSSILLSWSDNQPQREGKLYLIKYTGTVHSSAPKYHYKNTTQQSATIEDLKPNTEYEFAVQTVLSGRSQRSSTWSMSVVNTTHEAVPGTSPRDLTIVASRNGDPTTVTAHWQPPKMPNGQITGYVIFYTTDNTQNDRDWIVKVIIGDKPNTDLNGLQASQMYFFKIQARNHKGYGPLSNEVTFKTDMPLPSASQEPSISISLFLLGIIVISFFGLIAIGSLFNYFVSGRKKDTSKTGYIAAATSPKNSGNRHNNNNNGSAPPDLWIHHNDQVEMAKIDRNGTTIGGRDSPLMTRTATENSFSKMKKTNSTYGMNSSLYDDLAKPLQSPIDNIATMRRASTLRKPSNHAIETVANGFEQNNMSRVMGGGGVGQNAAQKFNFSTVQRNQMSIDQIDSVSSVNGNSSYGAPSTLNFYDHVPGHHTSNMIITGHGHMQQSHGAEIHSASGSSGYMSGNNSSSSPHSVVSNNTVLTQSSTNTALHHSHHISQHPQAVIPQSPPGNSIYMSNKRLALAGMSSNSGIMPGQQQLKSFGFPTPTPNLPSLATLSNGIQSPNQIYNAALSNLSSPSKKFLLTTTNGLSSAANLGGSSSTLASNGAKSTMNTYSDEHSISGGINIDEFNHEMANLDGMIRDSSSIMQNMRV